MAIKTDMAKAYDRLEWQFIQATMTSMGFPPHLVSTIMKCISTVSYSIILNGRPSTKFIPQRGIRQGDPLSPYLFILCANVFSALISKAQSEHIIHGVKISSGAPEISHLLFVDDSLIFCGATKTEATIIQDIINTYQQTSGQYGQIRINVQQKSCSPRSTRGDEPYAYASCSCFLQILGNAYYYW